MQGQEVRVEKLIVDSMIKIINKLHFPKTPLALPNIIARLCDEMEVPYIASSPIEVVPKAKVITTTVPQPRIHMEHPAGNMPQGYGWGQLQEDMANLLSRQTAHGSRLQDIEARQKEIWVEQQQFQQDVRLYQAQQKEQLQKFQEEQRAKNAEMTHVMANMSLDCQSADIYTNWALQQMNQNLVPIPPARIPRMIRENFQASRPLVHGMLRTRRSEGSSSGLDQQTPPAANTPREPSADNN
ncbi:hypothetical protein PIB30_098892 [Stylosanthes scabra]|uniref:Uncharacterized protein n=1 Tax=Stylosanthes scabra TaxID=79078 RepID=A0ABU6WUX0_9FABA|nr:hypothetical protein [Stylosanthes scabra]